MDKKWLLKSSGHPVLQRGEVECYTLSSVELESQTNLTLICGLLILTTHRLLWIPNSSTTPFYASGISLNSVCRIFPIKMPGKSIENPKVRFQIFISQEGKVVGEQRSNSEVMIAFVLTGKYDPDAFLVKFWEAWGGRAWEAGLNGSNSNEQIEKTINIVDSGVGASKEEEDVEIYLLDKDICTKCNKGGRLLVCSEVGCPLALHKECVPPQTLSINSMDNFYCSYCSYKRAFLRTNKARKVLLLAMKNLSLFFGESSANTQMQKAPEGASHPPIILGETTCDETAKHVNEDGLNVDSGQLENDSEIERATQVDENQEVGERFDAKPDDVGHQIERDNQVDEQQEEAGELNIPTQLKRSADSSRKRKCDDKRTEMQEHDLEPSSRLRKRKLTSSNEINIKEKNITVDTFEKRQNLSAAGVEKRSVEHKDETPTTSVKTSSRSVEHEEEVEDSLESSINVEHKEKTTTTTSTESSNESKPHHFRSPQKKRKRCLWRVEEEEILKEGVEKFSTKIKKNIPWKKLLEFGSHVFDNSRNASDLKDKWKNMQAK